MVFIGQKQQTACLIGIIPRRWFKAENKRSFNFTRIAKISPVNLIHFLFQRNHLLPRHTNHTQLLTCHKPNPENK